MTLGITKLSISSVIMVNVIKIMLSVIMLNVTKIILSVILLYVAIYILFCWIS